MGGEGIIKIIKLGKTIIQVTENFIFPKRCPICDNIVGTKQGICNNCEKRIVYIKENYCMKCGKPIDNAEQELCHDCDTKGHEFDVGRAVFLYNKPMKKAMYRFKYLNRREYAEVFAQKIVEHLREQIVKWEVETIVPIPLHKEKLRQRGYNQAALVARKVGEELGIPVDEKILARERKTGAQKSLNNLQRKNNLKNAFKIRQNDVQLKKVLLIDDIFTTGSTMDAASEALKKSGVKSVYCVSVSLGDGY